MTRKRQGPTSSGARGRAAKASTKPQRRPKAAPAAGAAKGARARRDAKKPARPAGAQAPLVLVVDDFKDGRDLMVESLEFAGLRAAEAADGHEALAKCVALRPDLVLMDLSLPGMDGWEVTRRLKRDPATKRIKVIALTAHAQADALERARQAGADGVITKPCLPTHVVEQVREVLGAAAPEGA